MTTELALLPAVDLVAMFRARTLSPVDATRAALERAESLGAELNAFRLLDPEGALGSARASEARWARGAPLGPIDGVPVTVKDVLLVRGWPTRRGSRTSSAEPADTDAPAVARLRASGAVLLGKTNLPEFGWKGVTDSPLSGITRNPWNPALTPGGSSGGAAAAAACGMGALHLGTDGGGSIRIPASFTGVFGFKPTFGRVPIAPHGVFASVAHLGPITRTVADAALLLDVIARYDARDWYALPDDGGGWLDGLEDGVDGLRVAYAPTLSQIPVEDETARLVSAAARRFADLGAHVEEADPGLSDAWPVFETHWLGAAYHLMQLIPEADHELVDPGLRQLGVDGARLGLLDYLKAMKAREEQGRAMLSFHDRYDLLLLPTMPLPAFEVGRDSPDPERTWGEWTPFTYPFNLTRQPAASVPCGFTSSGLPVGLQIVARLHDDRLVLRAARAFERTQPFQMPS
jgi:aspartyl-tRNA(Asn)/glutamyl-tRNA(Gln) amidotransferase subunit A